MHLFSASVSSTSRTSARDLNDDGEHYFHSRELRSQIEGQSVQLNSLHLPYAVKLIIMMVSIIPPGFGDFLIQKALHLAMQGQGQGQYGW
jgi:hypothetical protein